MRILVISAPFPQFSFVLDETLCLSNENVEVHVARYMLNLSKRRELLIGGIQVHSLSLRSAPLLAIGGLKNLAHTSITSFLCPKVIATTAPFSNFIAKIVKKYNLELIHAHFAYPEGFAALLAKNLVRTPLVLTLHGYDILTEPSINYGIRLEKRYDEIVRKVFAEADRVFVASKYVHKTALRAGCDPHRLVLLANGVDVKRFNPDLDGSFVKKRLGIIDQPIVFTLRWHEPKNGIEYLIKAVPFVMREIPNAIFIIGGSGIMRKYHEKLAKKLQVNQHVLFVGHIPAAELPLYYAACDVFVIPSILEAFGLVAVEAMACGKPVVGTNVGGIPDIIINGVNGFLVEPKNPQSIAEKIIILLKNPELRRKMGISARKIATEKFNIQKRIDKLLSTYNNLLS